MPATVSSAVDATGAGDCFDGAFVARIVAGDTPIAAARYANAAAALATTGYGAVAPLPRHADVAAFLAAAYATMSGATFRDDVFAGSFALVSGGTSGIGAAIGNQLARLGAHVIVTGATAQEAAAARAAAGFAAASAIVLDVRDAAAIAQCIAALPRLDILVNCAGIIRRGARARSGDLRRSRSTSISTARCALCAAARSRLRETRGCIVNTCSVYSFFGGPHAPGYTASKGGVAQLTKALAVAYAVDSIRVNAIAPGWIATPLTEIVRGDAQKSATILARTPLGRWGEPADVANVVSFLCSPAAAFMTGAIVPVDGGYLVA